MATPTEEDLEQAVKAGQTDLAAEIALALGRDPETARARAFNMLAWGVDSETFPSLEQIKEMQQHNALRAVTRIMDEHGGKRTCTSPYRLLHSKDYAGGPVDRRDWPWIAETLVLGDALTDDAAREFVVDAWSRSEFPESNLSTERWLEIFHHVGFLTDQDPDDLDEGEEPFGPPTATMRLYRGAAPQYARGMAWTTSPGKARWYAERFPADDDHFDEGRVYTAMVEPWRVLARFGARGESEIVIDPTDLEIDEA
ncbi:hypothetical protein [Nocardioides pakistanensis]